jgi:iron complex outermembrane receptor protein
MLFGIETAEDRINSTNLGKHSRAHEAGFFGFTPDLGQSFVMDLKLRGDYYQKWGWQESFNFNFGYKMMDQRLKLKCSAASAFRIPTFTELYYSDAANQGDPNLKKERANNFVLGAEFKEKSVNFGLDAFLRRLRSQIDWTRASTSDRWQAANLGRVDFYGLDFNSRIEPNLEIPAAKLEKLQFAYTYMSADKKTGGLFSKYALDILQHQFIAGIYHTFCGISLDWQLSYNRRYYGEAYFVGNIYLSKKIIRNHFNIEPFIRIDNFNNTKYTEIAGVLQPGRWIKSGMRLEW